MKEEKLQEIYERFERAPESPVMVVSDHEALEAFAEVRARYAKARLVVMRGIRYLTVTDAAVGHILEQLDRERRQMQKVVEIYEKEIAEIREVLDSEKRIYWSQNSTTPPPALSEDNKK